MKRRIEWRGSTSLVTLALLTLSVAAYAAGPTVDAQIYSTLPSTNQHRPEMALDGDMSTYFESMFGMDDGDDFLVMLSRPIPVNKITVTTGDGTGAELLTKANLETSPDGLTYSVAAPFGKDGVANTYVDGQRVEAIRIRMDKGADVDRLVIREIAIDSPVGIGYVEWAPGRGFVDLTKAPDLKAWADRAQKEVAEFWPDADAMLYSDDCIPPNMVNMVFADGDGVAATGGGVMSINAKWCRAHPEDTGLTVHEMTHVVQSYPGYGASWLVEGIADYVRWVKFEPEHFHPRINTKKATYHDAYQTTATFLGWCSIHYDSTLVTKLNEALRAGNYKDGLFKQCTGKDVGDLWTEFVAAYQADPTDILSRPLPPADKPRVLPAVTAGTSAPVDLTAVFDAQGIVKDGSQFSTTGGIDEGGAAYPGAVIGKAVDWKGVDFAIGPPNAPDAVTCQGGVVSLPSGHYSSLWLLGAAVDGNVRSQTFTVTYDDGTSQDLEQNFSDWYQPQDYPGESRAIQTPYRDMSGGDKDPRPFYVYSYGFGLNGAKTVKSLTMPDADDVKILAVSLAN